MKPEGTDLALQLGRARDRARQGAALRAACSNLNEAARGLWAFNADCAWDELISQILRTQEQALHALDYQLGKIIQEEPDDIPF